MKKILALATLPILLAGCSGLPGSSEPKTAGENEPIRVGVILPLDGFAKRWGDDARDAIELVRPDVESQLSRPLEITIESDNTEPMKAVTALKFLTSVKDVDGVVGGIWDFLLQPIAPVAAEAGLPLVSPNPRQTTDAPSPSMFYSSLPLAESFAPYGKLIQDRGWKRIGIIRFTSTWGDAFEKAVQDGAKAAGAEIVHRTVTTSLSNDFKTQVLFMKEKEKPDVLFLDASAEDMANVFRRAREIAYDLPPVVTYDTARQVFFDQLLQPEEYEKLIFTETVASPDFAAKFHEKYGREPLAGGTESVSLAFQTLAIALDRADGDRARAVEILASEEFPGGLSYTAEHDLLGQKVVLSTFRDGEIVPLVQK